MRVDVRFFTSPVYGRGCLEGAGEGALPCVAPFTAKAPHSSLRDTFSRVREKGETRA